MVRSNSNYQGQGSCSLCSFKDVYLIEFVKLPLKSKKHYSDASDNVLQTMMGDYLSKYLVLMPADSWPDQFCLRPIVYQKASQAATTATKRPPRVLSSPTQLCHISYFGTLACVPQKMLLRILLLLVTNYPSCIWFMSLFYISGKKH